MCIVKMCIQALSLSLSLSLSLPPFLALSPSPSSSNSHLPLSQIGEVLCRYEVEKKQAVEREDYDTAKEKKDQVNRIRQQVYDQLGVHGLLSGGGVSVHPLKRSLERGGHHPRVRNPPFTALSTGSTILSGLEEGREGEGERERSTVERVYFELLLKLSRVYTVGSI